MKVKISVSIEKDTDSKLEKILKNSAFRNKSHLIEYSVKKFLDENKEFKK